MSEAQLLSKIRKDARRIAKRFKLKYLDITTEHPNVRSRYGSCDEDRIIRLRLYNLKSGRFLKYPFIVHTLCHEMAHLKHMNHSRDFKDLNQEILLWARKVGIYSPKR